MTLFGRHIVPADLALAVAGVLGALLFVTLLPGAHPDATARYALDAAESEERARTFLEEQGYATDGLALDEAQFRRDEDLLSSLQRAAGRDEALQLLADSAEAWIGYYWDVDFEAASDEDGNDEQDAHVLLTQAGAPFEFSVEGLEERRPEGEALQRWHLDRRALAAALGPAEGEDDGLLGVPDSLLARRLSFDLSVPDSLAAADLANVRRTLDALRRDGSLDQAFVIPSLGPRAAKRLAYAHLSQTPIASFFAAGIATADSVWIPRGRAGDVAAVRFESQRRGQTVRADVEVFATGGLHGLDVSFNPEGREEERMTVGGWLGIAGTVLVVLISIGLLVAFFRRLSKRMIDVRTGVIDAVVVGLMMCFVVFLTGAASFSSSDASLWQRLGGLALGGGITFAMLTLFAFPFVAAVDAVGRTAFADKMLSMSMVRRLDFRNRYVGAALLRGVALAGMLLGLRVLGLRLLPRALVRVSGGFAGDATPHVLGLTSTMSGFIGYGLLVLLVGLAAFLWRRTEARAAVVAGVALLFGLLQLGGMGFNLEPAGYDALLGACSGALLGAVLLRYDALTLFAGLFLALTIGGMDEGWLVAGSPVFDDLLLALALAAALAGLGFVGVWSGETGREAEDYTPSYLKELAEQERLQRDIEIAQQVQRDFLPRHMPRLAGLDLAALCLPAREVGGDYYDFVELPGGRLGIVVGDVSGKGIEASFYMTLAKGYLQTLAEEERSPAEVLRRLNALFCRNAPSGTFITMIYGIVDPAAGTFCFARAGHNPLLHCRSRPAGEAAPAAQNGQAGPPEAVLLRPRGLAIGLAGDARFDDTIDEVTLPFESGDALVLYTDGFPEARNTRGEEFGEERLRERAARRGHVPARQLLQTLADDVHAFVEATGRHDDMTMVVVKHVGEAVPDASLEAASLEDASHRQPPASPSTS